MRPTLLLAALTATLSASIAHADPKLDTPIAHDVRLLGYTSELAALCDVPSAAMFDEQTIRSFLDTRYPLAVRLGYGGILGQGRADAREAVGTPARRARLCALAGAITDHLLGSILPAPGQPAQPRTITSADPQFGALTALDQHFELVASAQMCHVPDPVWMLALEKGETLLQDDYKAAAAAGWAPEARYVSAVVRHTTGRDLEGINTPAELCGPVYRKLRQLDSSISRMIDDQPLEVLGIQLGSSVEELTPVLALTCHDGGRVRQCSGHSKANGMPITWTTEFADDWGLVMASATLRGDSITPEYVKALVADFEPRLGSDSTRATANGRTQQGWKRGSQQTFVMSWPTQLDPAEITLTISYEVPR